MVACVDHWLPEGRTVGVGEARWPPSRVVPTRYVLDQLGPRPLRADDQMLWREVAEALDAYRTAWAPLGAPSRAADAPSLGGQPTAMGARQLVHYLEVRQRIARADRRLGRDLSGSPGPRSISEDRGRTLGGR